MKQLLKGYFRKSCFGSGGSQVPYPNPHVSRANRGTARGAALLPGKNADFRRYPVLFSAALFFGSLFITACSDAELPLLTSHRYDVISFGMPLAEAYAKLQQFAAPEVDDEDCSYVVFEKYPDISFMVENGIVTRADAGASILNSTGFSTGANSADLQKANPEITVMPHKYDPAGSYLILASFDNKSALVFEESGGVITQVRAGMQPSVEYVEGCS